MYFLIYKLYCTKTFCVLMVYIINLFFSVMGGMVWMTNCYKKILTMLLVAIHGWTQCVIEV